MRCLCHNYHAFCILLFLDYESRYVTFPFFFTLQSIYTRIIIQLVYVKVIIDLCCRSEVHVKLDSRGCTDDVCLVTETVSSSSFISVRYVLFSQFYHVLRLF